MRNQKCIHYKQIYLFLFQNFELHHFYKYIINLYSGCASCHPEAGEIAKKLVLVWEEYSQPPDHRYAIKPEGVDISAKIVKDEGGISSHQDGQAIDYGLISNSNEEISKILQYLSLIHI